MKIGIIGKGFVGGAVYEGLGWIGNEMSFYDPRFEGSKFEDILDTECVFLCVPTNPTEQGTCDTSIVEKTLENLKTEKYKGIVAIKSTVTPGTTQKMIDMYPSLDIVFIPEFLRERCSISDFLDNHDVCIIGCDTEDQFEVIKVAHGSIPKNFYRMSPLEAELSKYFNNVYNACRVTFANGFYEVCKAMGANYQDIYNAMILRDNISGHYLRASESIAGYSGKCLVKDTLAFCHMIEELKKENKLKVYPEIFKQINNDNNKYKRTIFDGSCSEEECFGDEVKIDI